MKSYLLIIALGFSLTAGAQEASDERFVGPPIDVSSWKYQRALQFSQSGVVELDLDPLVFMHSGNGLDDVRIVRAGRQLPFVAVKPGADRSVEVSVAEVIDPKTPLLSKWDIKLPAPDFPATGLLFETGRPSFQYTLSVTEITETKAGNQEKPLGNGTWLRRPGEAASPFQLLLKTPPHSDTIRMTATDGSTPRLEITSARAMYPLVRLLFRVSNSEPVYLCYGNPQALNPRYDMQVSRRDFMTTAKIVATLGPEEKPSPHAAGINHVVGNFTWNLDSIKFKILGMVTDFDRTNQWHVLGLCVAVLLLVKILKRILFGRRS
ncbi:hypothetical protein [Prosthecobacter vanneervenii]|uniref:DUF2330 domain-containing protein n=1 Tax=Prosthecobacter vanneervenii TaxID=48466 RepID=A0A7W7YG95_9BACT|nr:hypothetical protein [Prosthecobacter vanneervenii]MBB5035650.1 hypothetical protein [Prosthecobacter vanneervenii]